MNLENNRIKSRLMFSYDGFRKDSKKKSRVKGIKFFHKLSIKFSKKEFMYLNCLKSDKPCAKTIILHLERNADMIERFKLKKNHLKCLKLEVGSKIDVNIKSRFWKRVLPMTTFFDYLSCQDITNFIRIFSGNSTKKYRKIVNFSFPIIPLNRLLYSTLFKKIKDLHSLKMLSFNVQSEVEKSDCIHYLDLLKDLPNIQALFINCHLKDPDHFEILKKSLLPLKELKHLSLQCGQIGANHSREAFLNAIHPLMENHSKMTHLSVELYLPPNHDSYLTFLQKLEHLKSLKSLDLKLDCKKNSIKLENIHFESQVIPNIKYLVLDANDHSVGAVLAETILSKTMSLITCNLRNIDLTKKEVINPFFENYQMQEVQFSFDKPAFLTSLEPIFKNTKNFKNLSYFSVQVHVEEPLNGYKFDLKKLMEPLDSLPKLDTFVIEVLFPIPIQKSVLRKLFSKVVKLEYLVSFKLDLISESVIEDCSVIDLFKIPNLEILNVRIENLKVSKKVVNKIKEQIKTLKKIVSCTLEWEDFKLDRTI